MKDPAFPIVLVALGAAWLAYDLDWLPDWRFVIMLLLMGSGLLVLVLEGINKRSIVTGPFLFGLGCLWLLRVAFRTGWDIILPLAPILIGSLMLIARLPAIPEHKAKARSGSDARTGSDPSG